MATTLIFTGATGTVTGSHHLIDTGGARLLLDCGLYQGSRELGERNWQPFPVPAGTIDAVVLSHAHIDHSGYLPRLVHDGFTGPIFTTPATQELCALMLPDSARLQEEEAAFRNRKGATRHHPALPLYTDADAQASLQRFTPLPVHQPRSLPGGATATLRRAGHILGSATVQLQFGGVSLLYSGDLGRAHPLLLLPPEPPPPSDYVLMESTYGDRIHEEQDPRPAIVQIVRRIADQRGVLVVPAFAVGRAQELLYLLRQLEDAGSIPVVPVALDSPMAIDATDIVRRHEDELNDAVRAAGPDALRPHQFRTTCTVDESKALNAEQGPLIIISASGMATGGRVLHHLKQRLPDPHNEVLLAGYQAEGTRGRQLMDGASTVRIFHEPVPVRARVTAVDALSAHADASELVEWLRGLPHAPKGIFLVHGEDAARTALAARIHSELGWDARIPSFGDRITLS